MTQKEIEKVADFSRSPRSNGGGPKNPCYRSKLLPPTCSNSLPRSVSSHMVSNTKEILGLKSPSHQSFLSTNNHTNNHHGPRKSTLGRSKSMASVNHIRSSSNLYYSGGNVHNTTPRVSHHQPCANHVGGKTFSEMGTQTLPRPRKRLDTPPVETGCAASLKKRYVQGASLMRYP